jgi:electron transport complex protein RnfC
MARFSLGTRSFRGGVHPHDGKLLTQNLPLETMPDPERLLLPLQQHLGRPALPVVKKGEWVRAGQLLADAQDGISAVVRAPRAGVVTALQSGGTASGFPGQIIVLTPGPPPPSAAGEPARESAPVTLAPFDPATVTPADVVARVREAGIVGQGGAAFPTAIKLSPPKDTKLEVLIVNGCECEPYLTRDYRLMLEQPAELVEGAALIARVLGVLRVVIGVENNKPAAIDALRAAVSASARPGWMSGVTTTILPLRTKYPQGAEKMLIEAATGRQVPPGGLPMAVGVAIQNVGTVLAVRDAVVMGRVQTDAILTVSGRGIRRPANVRVPGGTPVADVLTYCGGLSDEAARIIVGGPMMGLAQHDLAAPVVKACSGILALTTAELGPVTEAGNCVRCGRCAEACPIQLMPNRLARLSELGRAEEVRDLGIEVCMECGTCAFACPSQQPLVQWLRLGKQQARKLGRRAS